MTLIDTGGGPLERIAPFFGRTYDETMSLLLSARHYVANVQPGEPFQNDPDERLHMNCEAMRLMTRLAQIMAWLLAQKALAAGELTRDEALDERFRLGAHDLCLVDTDARVARSSQKLGELVGQSRRLFERVARLDSQLGT